MSSATQPDLPSFSAVISTLGHRDLGAVLLSLSRQTLPVLEIIIVDQSDGDSVSKSIAAYSTALPIRLVRDTSRGLSRGRNAGIAVAGGDVLIFPDDDCWYPEDFCARIASELARGYDVVTGRTLPGPAATNSRMGRFSDKSEEIALYNVLYCSIEFSMAVRTQLAQGVKFDPRIGIGSGTAVGSDEGVDFLIRCLRAGGRGLFSPAIVAFHPDPVAERRPDLHLRGRRYAQGRGYMLRHYPFPLRLILREYIWPSGGTVLSFLRGDFFLARYYFNVVLGKIKGFFIVLDQAESLS